MEGIALKILILVFALLIELRIFVNGRSKAGIENDRGSLKILLFGLALGITGFCLFGFSRYGKLPVDTSYCGLLVVALGLLLRQWAIWTLGPLFTPVVSLEKQHEIVAKGPYRFLRHPSYTGLVLELGGAAFVISNYASLIAMMACILPALWYRIHIEEKFLTQKFGETYAAFLKKKPRIFP